MPLVMEAVPVQQLSEIGIKNTEKAIYQAPPEELIQSTLRRDEGSLSQKGALVIMTGKFTGRSPKDRFIIKDSITSDTVNWNEFNLPLDKKYFDVIYKKVIDYINNLDEYWVRDAYACADERYRMNIRIINQYPFNNHFVYNMFLRPTEADLENFSPDWHILSVPGLQLDPEECGIRQENCAIVSFEHKMILITGSGYTGEMKKGIFSVLNYILPMEHNVLSMHCSANMGKEGDTAIFFGLSGTGKTTLSADPSRKLIGDDEHGWTDDSVFNFEGGCYAKTINLTEDKEPEIFYAIRPGALVENTKFYPGTTKINFEDSSITENTRVSYPLHFISNAKFPSIGPVPKNIFFLTCDAFGVLPPISKLTPAQAMYQFISGYTAKVAGTEAGVTEPKPTFSACFGAPFIPLHPGKYAEMLGKKIEANEVNVWLVNTGWTGGAYGVGKRINLRFTRAMISAALNGDLKQVTFENNNLFKLAIPAECPGVPSELLNPRNTWTDKEAYDQQARKLAQLFAENFTRFADCAGEEALAAGPQI